MDLDWRRVAEPQEDGYDTGIVATLATELYGFVPKTAPTGHWLDNWVHLGPTSPEKKQPSQYAIGPVDHPSFAKGEKLLRSWPAMYRQCQSLLVSLQPILIPEFDGRQGSVCGPIDDVSFGEQYCTVFDPVGFVEAVVHELAHWKMHAMGIHLETWDDRLIANAPTELYSSPIRKDKLRPMGAVLQAQYSFIHILNFDLRVRPVIGVHANYYIRSTGVRMKEGRETLRQHFRGTPAGDEFMAGFYDWNDRLFAEMDAVLPKPKK